MALDEEPAMRPVLPARCFPAGETGRPVFPASADPIMRAAVPAPVARLPEELNFRTGRRRRRLVDRLRRRHRDINGLGDYGRGGRPVIGGTLVDNAAGDPGDDDHT